MTSLLINIASLDSSDLHEDDVALSYMPSSEYGSRSGFSRFESGSAEGIGLGDSTNIKLYTESAIKAGIESVILDSVYSDGVALSGTPSTNTYTFPEAPASGVYEAEFSGGIGFPSGTKASFYVLGIDNQQILGSFISAGKMITMSLSYDSTTYTLSFNGITYGGFGGTSLTISEVRRISL